MFITAKNEKAIKKRLKYQRNIATLYRKLFCKKLLKNEGLQGNKRVIGEMFGFLVVDK
jgi:hypothetical protein